MEDIQKQEVVDPNEIKQDEELAKEPVEEEVRQSVISELGLDETLDEDLIKKIVAKEIANKKNLSTAISQKINWRQKATANPEVKPQAQPQSDIKITDDTITQKVNEVLEQRDIDSLELSDDLKKEVKTYAKVNGVSIKTAFNSDYIKFRREQEEKARKADEASLSPSHRGKTQKNYSEMTPADFDLSTEDGRTEYGKWKEFMRKNEK